MNNRQDNRKKWLGEGYRTKRARGVGGSGWEIECLNWVSGGALAGDDNVKRLTVEMPD